MLNPFQHPKTTDLSFSKLCDKIKNQRGNFMNKKISYIFAVFDLYMIYRYVKIATANLVTIKMCFQMSLYAQAFLSLLQIIFILSVIVSGVLYIFNKKIAYFMYFPQFVLRFLFVMPTFGILLRPIANNAGSVFYKLMLTLCGILEIGRLIVTIVCLVKNRKNKTEDM